MRPCSSYLFIHLSKMYCSPTALQRCHSEPVTVSLAWESALSFVGKRIAAPVCGLARNDKVRRGGRPKPPSAREVAARSAGGGRDVTRFSLPQSAAPTAPSQGGLAARHCRADGTSRTPPPTFVIRQARLPLRRGRCPHRPAVGNRIPAAGHAGPALQGVCVRADRVVRPYAGTCGRRPLQKPDPK